MRILAGALGGRSIAQPKTDKVRPMSEKVRGALFNISGDVSGLKVLDAYAGSGAVGLEALSRGAASVTGIDELRMAAETIKKNVESLGVKEYRLYATSLEKWLTYASSEVFDLIVADPPYEKLELLPVEQLGGLLAENGVLIVSHSSRKPAPDIKSLEFVRTYTYGDTALSFYKSVK